jgi:hypothetical protein
MAAQQRAHERRHFAQQSGIGGAITGLRGAHELRPCQVSQRRRGGGVHEPQCNLLCAAPNLPAWPQFRGPLRTGDHS